MATTAFQALKRRARRPKLFGFHTFADPGCPVHFTGAFRDNIRSFLGECGEIEDYNVQGMPVWTTLLVNERNGLVVPLYTIQESVKHSARPFCDHCRCIGWSHHFLSKRRYHFIIPVDDEWSKPLERGVFDLNTHLLHGLIHCNGYGHLICINGREGGSKYLSGREIMDLWDRICTSLRTRKITVEDTSRKRSVMDLRLLYGIAYGNCWFGRWGYKFCHGSFGVTEHNYESATRVLTSLHLDELMFDSAHTVGHGRCNSIKQMVGTYREISETQLITVSDLFRFMLTLKARAPVQRKPSPMVTVTTVQSKPPKSSPVKEKPTKYRKFTSFVTETANSRWPARRLEYAAEVIVAALKEKQGGMSRQEVRDAARLHIGDTGLLDFVIKSINNLVVGNYVVHRAVNPSKRVLEFTIQEVNRGASTTPAHQQYDEQQSSTSSDPPGSDVHSDIEYMYNAILDLYPETEMVGLAIRVVMDSKHFVKEWPFDDDEDDLLRFICGVVPESADDMETGLTRPVMAPGEVVVIPPYATIGELKRAAEQALRDTYCIMKGFALKEIEGVEVEDEEEEVVFGKVESGGEIRVRGSGMELKSKFKYEGGDDNWTVDCGCGARDDDGERMVACDVCEVWQHTRCGGIPDDEAVPPLFLCGRCTSSIMPSSLLNHHYFMDLE